MWCESGSSILGEDQRLDLPPMLAGEQLPFAAQHFRHSVCVTGGLVVFTFTEAECLPAEDLGLCTIH
jgi:hypothetical protein